MIPMQCSENPVKFDKNMSDKDKALWYAEWQANELAIRVAIPKHLVEEAIDEYNNDMSVHNPADVPFSGRYYQNMIYKLSWDFNVPNEVMKIRLRQLGYDYADGTFVTVDDCIYAPFSFPQGTLKQNETFVIDRDNYERLLLENEEFAELINSGMYIYLGYVVCRLDTKYIKVVFNSDSVDFVLSSYACEHAEECLIKFCLHSKCADSQKYPFYDHIYLNREPYSEKSEYYYNKKDNHLSSLMEDRIQDEIDKIEQYKSDKKILAEMENKGVETFSDALKYVMDKANKPRITKDNIAEVLGCDGKTVQNYRNGKAPDTIEKVMLICLACKTGPEVSKFLIKKSVGGIPDVGMKKTAYNFLLEYTNTSLEYWNKILDEFGVEHIERFGAEDK